MPRRRRKISAAVADLHAEINRLERVDAQNQAKFSTSKKGKTRLSKRELQFLTEAVFFMTFRAYENFIRDVFLLYCQERQTTKGLKVKSFLKPKDFSHAEQLIQSSMRFLDWSSPDEVIERAELYLEKGFPVKLPYTVHLDALRDLKHIRNHIAHNSKESFEEYTKVVRKYYRTMPLRMPPPGEFLLLPDKKQPKKYNLQVFFEIVRKVSVDLS
jgi:hypothetical protein